MDEGTYWSRVMRIANMMDFRTAFVTDAQVDRAVDLIEKHEKGEVLVPDPELHVAKKLVEAVVHPDTGHKIFLPLRLSCIVPCNLVLDTLMLSAKGPYQNVAAQWLNQTYNSLHYYANRNASTTESVESIFHAYIGATAGSVGAVLGLHSLLDRIPANNRWTPLIRRFVPFSAVAAADVLNMGITRKIELIDGINIYDEHGDLVGKSNVAGTWAVGSCIGGRIAAAAPILILPPTIMHRLEQIGFFNRRGWIKTPLLMTMIGFSIQTFVPLFFGMFKQRAEIDVTLLEPKFQHIVDKYGNPIDKVWYNKGI